MKEIKWNNNHIEVEPVNNPLKITGTRFGAILGANKWVTPFEVWCEITRTYKKPFEDTIYTVAGKTIEPKQAEYMKKSYFMTGIKTPTDIYGDNYFQKTMGDFFPADSIFGGMWDYLLYEDGKLTKVLEMKTTKRSEDWMDDIPEYYALQASLYAYLLGLDEVVMVCSFLEDSDYEHPENFKPCADNTIVREFKVSERYPNFNEKILRARRFHLEHIKTGISPDFNEKSDADILKELRTNTLNPDTDIAKCLAEADELKNKLDVLYLDTAPLEARLKVLNDIIKKSAIEQFRDGDKKVNLESSSFIWSVSKTETTEIDKDCLKADGLLDKYSRKKESYRITTKAKGDK